MSNIRSTRQALTVPEALAVIHCVGAAADLHNRHGNSISPHAGSFGRQLPFNLMADEYADWLILRHELGDLNAAQSLIDARHNAKAEP